METRRPVTRARLAVLAAFASQGLVFISLTTRLPRIADHWSLGETALSLVLLMIVLLAGAGSVLAEVLAARRPSGKVLRAGLLLTAVAVPVLATAPVFGVYLVGVAAYGVGLGLVDATTNMQAVAVERDHGRPILPSFHGAWTLGGLLGAALALATGALPFEVLALVALVPLAVAFAPFRARTPYVDPLATGAAGGTGSVVPWRPILLVGLGMVIFYMVDTAAATWGPTYLDRVFPTPERLVALATLPYLLSSLAVRLAGDRLVAAHGAVRVLRAGTVVAVLALAVVVVAPSWPVAVLGFLLLGGGISVIAPLSFSAAGRIAGDDPARVDAVIARFNQFNYVGGLLGAVLTGLVGAGSLRVGFAVPMVLVLAMLPLARAFAPAGAEEVSARRP
jgi:MFS family permease